MRIIKFRGKKKQTGKWLYGDLMNDNIGGSYIYPIDAENLYKENAVIPDTVGQFSGLKTKATPLKREQEEIFEDDILRVPQTVFHIEYIGRVVFEYGRFLVRSLFSGTKWDLLNAIDDGAEIIGNAHDNPELLEKYMTIEIKQSER